ncbi:MAG: regulatory protein RecX [Candidatus Coatesbacteria bacterium]
MKPRQARHPESEVAARWSAMRMIERRPHAVREVVTKLTRKGYEPPAIEAAVERLKEQGLLDDEKFAAAFVRSRIARKPTGRRLISMQLTAHGVDRAVAAAATAGAATGEAERAVDAARRYLRRKPFKYAGQRNLDAAKERSRLIGWLLRQGFDSDAARKALAIAGVPEEED